MHIATTPTTFYYRRLPADVSFTAISPVGVTAIAKRPCIFTYRGRTYVLGQWSSPMVFTEFRGLHRAGIIAPQTAPTLAAGTGSITGDAIGYYTFAQYVNNTLVQESNPSAASGTVALVAQGRAWSALQTVSLDARVTHIHLYVSMDGALPRLAAVRELGTSTVTETVSTAVLVNQTALPSDDAGEVDVDARGVPSYALFGCIYHDRAWYVVPGKPGVYYSKLFEPESVNTDNFERTKDGEIPTGLAVLGDELVIFYGTGFYVLTGFGPSDFSMRKGSSDYGCISHHSIVNIQGTLFFASQQGVAGYDGSRPRNLMARSRRNEWIAAYAANPSAYENSAATDDKNGQYLLLVTLSSGNKTFLYVGNYRAMLEESALEPWWTDDIRARADFSIGVLAAAGEKRYVLAFGSEDGYIRTELASDASDDSDTYAKKFTVQHPHYWTSGGQGGSSTSHGGKFTDIDLFCLHPSNTITAKVYVGDETAINATAPHCTKTWAAPSATAVSKTSEHATLENCAGKGATVKVEITSPVGVEYRGLNLLYLPQGAQQRASGS